MQTRVEMYRKTMPGQIKMEIPFNVSLNHESKWIRLAEILPWERIDEEYAKNFKSNEGQIAKPSRLAFGALYIQVSEGFTDEQTREHIRENPHMQYFCGYGEYNPEPPFDASMMTHFRKRIPSGMIIKLTEEEFAADAIKTMDAPDPETEEEAPEGEAPEGEAKDDSFENEPNPETAEPALENDSGRETAEPESETSEAATVETVPDGGEETRTNRGTLILDATCCPQDISYPTDVGLLNRARELSEEIIDVLYGSVMGQYPYKPRTYREVARKDYLKFTKARKPGIKTIRKNIKRQLQWLSRNLKTICELVARGAPLSGLPPQLYRKLPVINEVYRQQREMYDANTHTCEGRIVSISQPHVRPIVRGKDGRPTEFGSKVAIGMVGGFAFITDISWENIAEAALLPQAAEDYKRMFGFYPKAILADRIYPNRFNRTWCKDRGIRLSGPALGRKSESIKRDEAKQRYRDGCERNAVEGEFGVVKRKFGLDRIMPKLPNTSLTAVAMGFFAVNMERRLRLLFSPDSYSYVFYDFDSLRLGISEI
jgi:hypothetical protein